GLLGFLVYNHHPAKVFMGDTGSLALGGFVSSAFIMMNMPVYLILSAFIYFAEVISVIIQVLYFKATGGKRFFKMAPIHHHFELCGWKEVKVVTVFTLVTLLLSVVALTAI
ncbi:MAG: phospho-N-acetylmuramoyl-pentapeptide-transferase, partial [Lachnospiraceae bacterium]|nr:phospho-N-acetylmuramoyl-pentapeptide-transferase [Lachnospiraceae bacterium]